jgi:hypothetical protein
MDTLWWGALVAFGVARLVYVSQYNRRVDLGHRFPDSSRGGSIRGGCIQGTGWAALPRRSARLVFDDEVALINGRWLEGRLCIRHVWIDRNAVEQVNFVTRGGRRMIKFATSDGRYCDIAFIVQWTLMPARKTRDLAISLHLAGWPVDAPMTDA